MEVKKIIPIFVTDIFVKRKIIKTMGTKNDLPSVTPLESESEYNAILQRAVTLIEEARTTIAKSVSQTVNLTHWQIGKLLHEKKLESTHGSRVVRRLSVDLKQRYPKMGMSPRNLWYMKTFYERYSLCDPKVQRAVALLPWSYNILLINKKLDDDSTLYYAEESVKKGWNRDLLLNAIKLKMHKKQLTTTTDNNFTRVLPVTQAEYANEVFRSNYNLGFLNVTEPLAETELEDRLVDKVKLFLMELGKGFTFIGNQYPLEFNGKTSKVDLLFFHRGLRCLVAIDLKIGEFKPEYAGKMNYYLSLLDRLERWDGENRSIGIILCAEKDRLEVELSLEDMGKPIGVADYQLLIPKQELQQVVRNEFENYEKQKKNEEDTK